MSDLYFVEDFFQVADGQGIHFEVLDSDKASKVLVAMTQKFFPLAKWSGDKPPHFALWEYLEEGGDYYGAHLPNSSEHREAMLDSLPEIQEIMFCFDLNQYNEVFIFSSYQELKAILKDSYNFDFYLFSLEENYLICWHKYETLFGLGKAAVWVEKIQKNWRT